MSALYIIDTGPLVALLSRKERHHAWVVETLERIKPPLLTCDPVLTEAFFLLSRFKDGPATLMDMVSRGFLLPSFNLAEEAKAVSALVTKYASVSMPLADACLVRMSETHASSKIITLDSDFKVYRRHSRRVIPTLMPD